MAKPATPAGLSELKGVIRDCPVIDNHAHNLLMREHQGRQKLEQATTEASDEGLRNTPHSLPHQRAVKQLSEFYNCNANFAEIKRKRNDILRSSVDWGVFVKRAFEGTHTVLLDDGFAPYDGRVEFADHFDATNTRAMRLVRIEHVAEELLVNQAEAIGPKIQNGEAMPESLMTAFPYMRSQFVDDFVRAIEKAYVNVNVVGFKSVVCYRTGLNVDATGSVMKKDFVTNPDIMGHYEDLFRRYFHSGEVKIQEKHFNDFLVRLAIQVCQDYAQPADLHLKPFQFHTGLGDSDLDLLFSNPAHLQPLIERFPQYPIVLLHSSYPYTREAGYLATVFANVYLDIGEVFPMLSRQGQERVLHQSLEQVPTSKILWSTDGHWMPETFWLANKQMREVMETVMLEYVCQGDMYVQEAINAVENILFHNSNRLYDLKIEVPNYGRDVANRIVDENNERATSLANVDQRSEQSARLEIAEGEQQGSYVEKLLETLGDKDRMEEQWIDLLGIVRCRMLPFGKFKQHMTSGERVTIAAAARGLLPGDMPCSRVSSTGQLSLEPDLTTLNKQNLGHVDASVMCSWKHLGLSEAPVQDTRIIYQRVLNETHLEHRLDILMGFEIEFVLLDLYSEGKDFKSLKEPHGWSSCFAGQSHSMQLVTEMVTMLESAQIPVEQYHSESAPGQYEIVLAPLPALQAVDKLYRARQIISHVAHTGSLHATFSPCPIQGVIANGAHVHLSLNPTVSSSETEKIEHDFWQSVLTHLRTLQAFCQPQEESYARVAPSTWGSGAWVGWGTQNREMPLRKIAEDRYEVRCLDGTANMYLALAALISVGLKGINEQDTDQEKEVEMRDCDCDPAKLEETERVKTYGITNPMCKELRESLDELDKDVVLRGLLSDEFVDFYLALKKEEQEKLKEVDCVGGRRSWVVAHY